MLRRLDRGVNRLDGVAAPFQFRSVGLPDEDERGPLHDGGARADERDVYVLDLAFPRTSRRLQRPLDDVPKTVDAPRAQAASEGVQRELAVQLHASVLDEVQ